MAFTGQTFSFEQVLTSAEMNQMDTNIDEVRTFHKGAALPAELEAGVAQIRDDLSPWLFQIYDGAAFIPIFRIDPTNDRAEHHTGDLVIGSRQSIQFVSSAGTLRTLIGPDTSSPDIDLVSDDGFLFHTTSGPGLVSLLELRGQNEGVSSGGLGQLRALDGTPQRPTYAFTDDVQLGMFRTDDAAIGFAKASAEQMRITNGWVLAGKQVNSLGVVGTTIRNASTANGQVWITTQNSHGLLINRLAGDGKLISFFQDDSEEGDISVSGTTVALNGAHLGRRSQLADSLSITNIPRGTVMAVVDELAEWHYIDGPDGRFYVQPGLSSVSGQAVQRETNEILARSTPSAEPGDRRLYGIFDRWDDDYAPQGPEWNRDCYLAATGDFPVRVTGRFAPGDLLESNGDGTARAQSGDLVRASTIGRVTLGAPTAADSAESLAPVQLMIG